MANSPTLLDAGVAWLRGLVRREGVLRGGSAAAREMWNLASDFLPSRKRLRYGDIDYDFDYGVNTTWAAPPFAVRLREIFTRGKYQPSEPGIFHEIMSRLPIQHEHFTFLDLGSGKGRTLLMASNYPFHKIMGAEIIPELHALAQENVKRYHSEKQKCFVLSTWMGNARDFPFPIEPIVVYLFNPFPLDILREVLERLRVSLAQHPREAYVIYHNLVHEDVFQQMAFLEPLQRMEQYAIYRARPD